jgi:phosphoglycerate kinase
VKQLAELLEAGVRGRKILVRADLNTPLKDGVISDDGRIRAALPTLQALSGAGARVILLSHLGRPKGMRDASAVLAPVGVRLAELLASSVITATDTVGESAHAAVAGLEDGDVALLENVRFEASETSKDAGERSALARSIAALAGPDGAFVQDAFGVVHRAQASVSGIPEFLPAYAGLLVGAELDVLKRLTEAPQRPYAVVLGGSKVSDKLAVIQALLPTVDTLLVGGGMCFTFLKAQGHEVGSSLLEADQVEVCRQLLEQADGRIVLPVDVVAAASFAADAAHDTVSVDAIPADRMGLDIGPRSVALFTERLKDAQTIFWNGPMGVFEMPAFAAGTEGVLRAVAGSPGFTVVGGGDSAAAVRLLGPGIGIAETDFGHISTGGGASLEFLEGKLLPGLAALEASA